MRFPLRFGTFAFAYLFSKIETPERRTTVSTVELDERRLLVLKRARTLSMLTEPFPGLWSTRVFRTGFSRVYFSGRVSTDVFGRPIVDETFARTYRTVVFCRPETSIDSTYDVINQDRRIWCRVTFARIFFAYTRATTLIKSPLLSYNAHGRGVFFPPSTRFTRIRDFMYGWVGEARATCQTV